MCCERGRGVPRPGLSCAQFPILIMSSLTHHRKRCAPIKLNFVCTFKRCGGKEEERSKGGGIEDWLVDSINVLGPLSRGLELLWEKFS